MKSRELTGEQWLNSPERRRRDVVVATVATTLTLPVVASFLTVSRVVDGPDPMFYQKRVGKDGKLFEILILRTMKDEDDTTISFGPHDNRATRFGRLLRLASIDELPQAINVLKGDMAFVGPRPLVEVEFTMMEGVLPPKLYNEWYEKYCTARPGILSSFSHMSHKTSVIEERFEQRAQMDIYDFDHASLAYDKQILGQLASTISAFPGHILARR